MASVNVLLGLTGSVATVKWPQIVLQVLALSPRIRIKIVATKSALHFFHDVAKAYDPKAYEEASVLLRESGPAPVEEEGKVQLLTDEHEWKSYRSVREDAVLHIELRKWADVFLIAPLSANTLAKIANGLCDNLLTCIARAWDFSKPLILAPAMNTAMWSHPVTSRQLSEVVSFSPGSVSIVAPVSKALACGDVGTGALAAVETITAAVAAFVEKRSSRQAGQGQGSGSSDAT